MDGPRTPERRELADRRRSPRGGRRPGDQAGFAPLVMIIDADDQRRDLTEAILAKLQFAVAPVDSIERAISVAHALQPSVIVCAPGDEVRIRESLRLVLPVVAVAREVGVTDALVEIVRAAIRSGM